MATSSEIRKLLELRRRLQRRRPKFVRCESWRYKRIKESWRRPRGIDSHMREQRKGWPRLPKIGFASPKKVKGLHPSGYEEVLVYSPKDLEKINPEKQAARIAHTVGLRKRLKIMEEAENLGIKILNPLRGVEEIESEESEETSS